MANQQKRRQSKQHSWKLRILNYFKSFKRPIKQDQSPESTPFSEAMPNKSNQQTEIYIGEILYYYPKIGVGVVALAERLSVGDTVHFKSPPGRRKRTPVDFAQAINSLEIEHKLTQFAESGQAVAMKLDYKVYIGDRVYKRLG